MCIETGRSELQLSLDARFRSSFFIARNEDAVSPKMSVVVKTAPQEEKHLKFQLSHPVVPQESTFKILSTKIEIMMKKSEAIRWETLEMEGAQVNMKPFTPNQYPSSSLYSRNWDKLVRDIKDEEKNEKLEGDTALSDLFQQIYSDGLDDVRHATNKSFMESGGTILSTNWKYVGKRKVKVRWRWLHGLLLSSA
ncbi:protein SGT1 homolog isoform X1 [Paramormyrops kingsleyae]|uniref:protein SGT1 homolog isoform X1 n=2 Tax=Paramormyrops kingsleyae TaxID=1676925 RepID=UPI000CD60348|nr:protein SGT1 homolog isoform X1 [Paramormyrops kingsleyae]